MAVLSAIFLYPVPALFVGSAAVCLLKALRSGESGSSAEAGGEEQERAMFRALERSSATAAGEPAEPVRFPQMPDLARLQAALLSEASLSSVEELTAPNQPARNC
jgi:hypothetical protein